MTAKVITVANQKGGTGKTTSLLSVSGQLAATNHKILIIDLDPQGNDSTALGLPQEPGAFNLLVNHTQGPMQWVRMTGRKNLEIIPGDRSTASAQILLNAESRSLDFIRRVLEPLLPHYHYILIDTAPSVGGIQERAVFAADYVLIPTATEFLSSNGLMQMMSNLKYLAQHDWDGKLIGILPTFYDDSTKESRTTLEEITKEFGEAVLSPIHRATILRECAAEGRMVHEVDPLHRATREYAALMNYILQNT
jgi:chromosome partitioning protein